MNSQCRNKEGAVRGTHSVLLTATVRADAAVVLANSKYSDSQSHLRISLDNP